MHQHDSSASAPRQRLSRRLRDHFKQTQPEQFEFRARTAEALCAGQVSKTGFLICELVMSFTSKGRPFWMGNAAISKALNVSPKTVANELSILRRNHQITVRRDSGGPRFLEVAPAHGPRPVPGFREHKRLTPSTEPKSAQCLDLKRGCSEAVLRPEPPPPRSSSAMTHVDERAERKARRRAYRAAFIAGYRRGFLLKRSYNKPRQTQPRPRPMETPRFPAHPLDQRPKCDVEPWDRELWAQIRSFALKHRQPVSRARRNQAEAVAIARRRFERSGVSREEILRVWAWYAATYGTDGVRLPMVTTGAHLYDRWSWITDKYRAAHKDAAPLVQTAETRFVLSELSGLSWPAGAESKLPAVVAQSAANLEAFCRRLFATSIPRMSGELEAVRDLVRDRASYLADWFRSFWNRVQNWAGWSGDVGMAVWSPTAPAFARAASTAVGRYTGDASGWTILWAMIQKEI